jgi:microsomal dipeptidase-like Zn-dependent dipeptidase
VRRILLTHPSFTHPAISAEEASTLTDGGALAEVTAYQLLHQEGCDASFLAAFIRRVGPDRVVLSSDAGQPDSPRPPVALQQLIDALAGEGLDRARLDAMASEVPHRLVDPDR